MNPMPVPGPVMPKVAPKQPKGARIAAALKKMDKSQ